MLDVSRNAGSSICRDCSISRILRAMNGRGNDDSSDQCVSVSACLS